MQMEKRFAGNWDVAAIKLGYILFVLILKSRVKCVCSHHGTHIADGGNRLQI
jgi:hypothetical protein